MQWQWVYNVNEIANTWSCTLEPISGDDEDDEDDQDEDEEIL